MSINITDQIVDVVIAELAAEGRLHELDDGQTTVEDEVAAMLEDGFDFSEAAAEAQPVGYVESRQPFLF